MTTATRVPDPPTEPDAAGAAAVGVRPGSHDRLGATLTGDGVDFVVYAKHATGLELLLFDGPDDLEPGVVITFDPADNRTGDYWHIHVPGVRAGQHYGYRADGPWAPGQGLRFDARRVLLDP